MKLLEAFTTVVFMLVGLLVNTPLMYAQSREAAERLITEVHPSWIPASLRFSPDSRRAAYVIQTRVGLFRTKQSVIVDGKQENQYDQIPAESLIFSPDSRRLAYGAKAGDKLVVVVDGQEGTPYDGVGGLIFSPDSRHLAYLARVGNKPMVVVDGQEGKPYDGIGAGGLIFSPDSRRLAYAARAGSQWVVVVDGQERKRYEGKGYEGGLAGARIIFDSATSLHYMAGRGSGIYLVEETLE